MNSSWRRILIGGVFFGLTCIVAVAGYMMAGWNFLDAIYMVVITVFGVGYGEAKPLDSPTLKLFTMGVIIAGCSSGIYVVGGFVQMVAEGEINRVLGSRRLSKGIDGLSGHALVCGFGRVGQMLAHDLAVANFPFVVIDSNEGRVAEAQAAGYFALAGSASEESTLELAGIARAKVLATVLPDDTINVFIALTARDLNPTIEIIARAESPATEKKLLRSGANRIVLPALIGASKIANMIIHPSAEDMLATLESKNYLNEELKQIGLSISEIELKAGSALIGQRVENVEMQGSGGIVVVAIKRQDGSMVRPPQRDTLLESGDKFVVIGHAADLPQLTQRAKARPVIMFRGATA